MQPLDLLFLVVFLSFFISRYHFLQIFKTSFSIVWKNFRNEFFFFNGFTQLCSQIRMQTFLEISPNFYNDLRWHDFVSVYLFQLVKYQPLPLPWAFTILVPPVKEKNKLTQTISYSNKAFMNFHHDSPNSHVPTSWFLGTYSLAFNNKLS